LWGLPLLVLTVVANVSGIVWTAKMLGLIGTSHSHKASRFVIFVAFAALACAVYLGLEAGAWAGLFLWLGAMPNWHEAMLYSLGAITSYGHAPIFLDDRWRLLGAIRGGQRPDPLWPHDRVPLRRHSRSLAAAAGLTPFASDMFVKVRLRRSLSTPPTSAPLRQPFAAAGAGDAATPSATVSAAEARIARLIQELPAARRRSGRIRTG
jgi:hypothetical protein